MRTRLVWMVSMIVLTTLACETGAPAPTATLISLPAGPTASPQTAATSGAPAPTEAPSTSEQAPPPAFPTPTRMVAQPGPTSAGVTRVKIYLIAREDGGKSGPLVGCGDSAVAIDRDIPATQAPLNAALEELFALKVQFYGQSGLYNALYSSNLSIVKLGIDPGTGLATIQLSGTMSLAGECDDPRFQAQIEYTAKQFPTVKSVAVTVNGTPLSQLLGGVGGPTSTP